MVVTLTFQKFGEVPLNRGKKSDPAKRGSNCSRRSAGYSIDCHRVSYWQASGLET
ncbi:hypothetical protein BDZ89DRAFT_1057032, partial [Hymenopellis radicata]